VYEDTFEQDRPRGGRGALIAAWVLLAACVGGAVGYVFLVPAEPSELAKYGRVEVALNPSQTATSTGGDTAGTGDTATGTSATGATATGTSATGTSATGTTATGTTATGTTGTATTGTATATGTAASDGDSGAAGTQTAADAGGEASGITGESIPAEGGGTGTATGASGTARTGESPEPSGTSGAGTGRETADAGGTSDQVANLPEAPESAETGADAGGQVGDREGGGGEVTGESTVTGRDAPEPQWQQYARALSPPEGVDRIAVVVRGLGLSSAATEAAIKRLPGEISLSFSPYARRSVEWTLRARARGHEVLMDLPMEPRSYPSSDPGPQALMTSRPTPDNLERLKWILGKGRELVGVVGQMGSAFVKNKRAVSPILRHLKQRGLIYVDNGDVPGNAAVTAARELAVPVAVNTRTLDDGQISRAAIRGRLVAAERLAKQNGQAVVMAHPYPVTIDLLQQWSRTVAQRGLALVPITNIVRSPDRTEAAQLR
jgi:polysaccharide deacetylase 2 family uncharacterized protein YibQ